MTVPLTGASVYATPRSCRSGPADAATSASGRCCMVATDRTRSSSESLRARLKSLESLRRRAAPYLSQMTRF